MTYNEAVKTIELWVNGQLTYNYVCSILNANGWEVIPKKERNQLVLELTNDNKHSR